MKRLGWKSIRKYLLLFLADVSFCIGVVIISVILANKKYSFLFSYADIYVLLSVSLYLILRGVLSRIFLKCVWLPNLIFFVEVWLVPTLLSGEFSDLISPARLILTTVLAIIPTITALITGGIIRLIHFLRKKDKAKDV